MVTQTLEKLHNQRFMALEEAFEGLRDEWEEQSRYMAAFLATRTEKRISLERMLKKYHLRRPK